MKLNSLIKNNQRFGDAVSCAVTEAVRSRAYCSVANEEEQEDREIGGLNWRGSGAKGKCGITEQR